jgi:hypothetical protein
MELKMQKWHLKEITCSSFILVCIKVKPKKLILLIAIIIYCDIQRSAEVSSIAIWSRAIPSTITKIKR